MKLNKMILGLSAHKYAPELNELVLINGVTLRVNNCTTIKQAKNLLFPHKVNNKFVTINVVYPAQFDYLNRTYKGGVNNTLEVKNFIDKLKLKHYVNVDELLYKPENLNGILKPKFKVTFKKACNI